MNELNVGCPQCEEALLEFSDDIVLWSMPAQRKVHCPECEFSTLVSQGETLSDPTGNWTLKNPWRNK